MAEAEHGRQGAGAREHRAPARGVLRLHSEMARHTLSLDSADALAEALPTVLPGWDIVRAAGDTHPDATLTQVTGDGRGRYAFTSFWSGSALTGLGLAGATCGAVADLVQAFVDARPETIGLHCGAVRIGGHLVAFTGTYRAGKSTLVTRLGLSAGCALYCDDILPVDRDGRGLALGVQPRLRLPLPDGAASAFRQHVARNMTVHDRRYGYVTMPGQAPLGQTAPLAAMVVLSRDEGARARFHRLDTSDAAAFLIRQNIADPGDPEMHYDRIAALAEGMTCLALVYSDLEEAVELIRGTFGAAAIPNLGQSLGPPVPLDAPEERAAPADLATRFVRAGDVIDRRIGADTFLWQMEERNFFSLNPVGGAIWTLLEAPQTGQSLVVTLQHVFPDAPRDVIARDVAHLLGQLAARGLIAAE